MQISVLSLESAWGAITNSGTGPAASALAVIPGRSQYFKNSHISYVKFGGPYMPSATPAPITNRASSSHPLSDMISHVDQDRVSALLDSDNFRALRRQQELDKGVNFSSAIAALQQASRAEGYTPSEMSAALLVADGMCHLDRVKG